MTATMERQMTTGQVARRLGIGPQPVVQLADQRPEAVVGAAFVGGLLLAAILRRLGR